MCNASKQAQKVVEALTGETYWVMQTACGFGALVPEGHTVDSCVACIRGKRTVRLSGIPKTIQRRYGIGATEVVTFHEAADDGSDEVIVFGNDTTATFGELGQSGQVRAYIGTLPMTSPSETSAAIETAIARADELALA